MKKLVLAIIGVICVQFIFVHYMTLQTPFEVSLAPVITDLEIALAGPFDDEQPSRSIGSAPAAADVARSVKRTLTPPGTPVAARSELRTKRAARPTVEQPYFPDPPMAARDDFQTVVIRYNGNNDDPGLSNCEPRAQPQPKKRTGTAKAILKKPWEWMKAFGSKFN